MVLRSACSTLVAFSSLIFLGFNFVYTVVMPTPAVIAGLVVGSILGTGTLCLGIYFMYRYVGLQCRKLDDWFQRNALKVGRNDDVESGRKVERPKHNRYNGLRSAMNKQSPKLTNRIPWDGETRDMPGLRGGHGYGNQEDNLVWAHERQMQTYMLQAALARTQPAAHPRALGWEQYGAPYDQIWHTPAVFQQAVPGTYYAYVLPRPDVTMADGQPSSGQADAYNPRFNLQDPQQSSGDTEQAGGPSECNPEAASKAKLKAEPTFIESDCLEVVEEYPDFIEKARKEKNQNERKKEEKRKKERKRRSSSTDLGTCSSSQSSTSIEDIPRDSIPSGAPHRAHLPSHDYLLNSQHTQSTTYAQIDGDPYARRPQRSERRQEREDAGDVRAWSRVESSADDRRQASNTFPFRCAHNPPSS